MRGSDKGLPLTQPCCYMDICGFLAVSGKKTKQADDAELYRQQYIIIFLIHGGGGWNVYRDIFEDLLKYF